MWQLQRMAVGKTHAVAGGKEQGRSILPSQPEFQLRFGGFLGPTYLDLPIRLICCHVVGKFLHQFGGAHVRGPVSLVLDPKEGGPPRQVNLAGLAATTLRAYWAYSSRVSKCSRPTAY